MSEVNTDGGVKHCGFVRRNIFFWIGLIFIYGFILFMCYSIYEDDLNGTAGTETAGTETSSAETVSTETASAESVSTETAGKESDAVVYTGSSDGFYAVDSSGVLSDKTVSFIDEQGRALCDSTKAQIVVVIVPNTGDDSLFDYSMNLFKEKGYGDSELDNGVLLLVTTDEVNARLTTGYGLEGCLPDGKCGRILDTYTMDALKSGDYDKAVTDTWKAVATTVYKEYGKEVPADVMIDTSEAAETAEEDTSVEEDTAEDTAEETAEPVTMDFVIKKEASCTSVGKK